MQEKTIRGVAWADLAVTLPFALPFVAEAVIALIYGNCSPPCRHAATQTGFPAMARSMA